MTGVREEAGDKWGAAGSRGNLGNIARLQGHLDEARDHLEGALLMETEVGDRWMIANVQNNLVALHSQELATYYSTDFMQLWSRGKITESTGYHDTGTVRVAGGQAARVLAMPEIEISSTVLRERARDGEPTRYLVPDAVRSYIDRHRLYGGSQ